MRLLLLVLAVAIHSSVALAQFAVTRGEDNLEIYDGEQKIAVYGFRDAAVRRPYLANVRAPNGTQLTRNFPPREGLDPTDHALMHPGIWLAFGKLNDGDFWRGKDEVRHKRFLQEPEVTEDRLSIHVENEYLKDGLPICAEESRIRLHRRPHGCLYLFDSTFQALKALTFGDQQEMGLGVRMETSLRVVDGNGTIVDSEGREGEADGWGQQAKWCDYTGISDGKRSGILLMPDPRNFAPSRFHSRDYGFTVANPFADKDFKQGPERITRVPAGKQLRLRFGVFVYSQPASEPLNAEKVSEEYLRISGARVSGARVSGARVSGARVSGAWAAPIGMPWQRHTIDDGSQGADGVRVADVNADGLPDLVTGWEEGGEVRVYRNPGKEAVKKRWPMVIVGSAPSVEDAVFFDVNGDGKLDVVACCEGKKQAVLSWTSTGNPFDAGSWQARPLPQFAKKQQWMFALPMQIDSDPSHDLVLGSKGSGASVGWLRSPLNAPESKLEWHPMTEAGWIMSLRSEDTDGDGDDDVVLSDRKGNRTGCFWLENPGSGEQQLQPWNRHPIVGMGQEVMFLDLADVNGDGRSDVVAAVRGGDILLAKRRAGDVPAWESSTVLMPQGVGTGKAVAVSDIDRDGAADIVVTCENAKGLVGVFWMRQAADVGWQAHDISGANQGIKFDRIELLDLDADGDLDVITCEERDNLGVIWYENPTQASS